MEDLKIILDCLRKAHAYLEADMPAAARSELRTAIDMFEKEKRWLSFREHTARALTEFDLI